MALHQIGQQQHAQIAGRTGVRAKETVANLQSGRAFAIVIVSRSGHDRR
jgi:hypothetical protein